MGPLKDEAMANEPTNARKSFGDIAPHLAEITDKVLFGEVWADAALSPRDRSLVTITSLISLYRTNEMPFHFKRALDNGVTREEIVGAMTHLAFYAGWPAAMTALQIARKVFEEVDRCS
jgi:4-carboxymuconolactone decarboxylase